MFLHRLFNLPSWAGFHSDRPEGSILPPAPFIQVTTAREFDHSGYLLPPARPSVGKEVLFILPGRFEVASRGPAGLVARSISRLISLPPSYNAANPEIAVQRSGHVESTNVLLALIASKYFPLLEKAYLERVPACIERIRGVPKAPSCAVVTLMIRPP